MRKVEVTIAINTSPQTVIKAFTDADMLKAWWGVERSLIELKPGGVYTVCWNISDKGFGYVSTGIITSYDPKTLLEIGHFIYMNPEKDLLGPMSLRVVAKATPIGSEVYIGQDGYKEGKDWDWYYDAVKSAWPVVANNLKNYLESIN